MIDVIDYGGGNLGSMLRCLKRLDIPYQRVNEQQPIFGQNPLLLPGVGSFGAVMRQLNDNGLADRIRYWVQAGTPFLGICIGLQVLFESSEESPNIAGLELLPGRVISFKRDMQTEQTPTEIQPKKIPQIGWNWVESQQSGWEDGYVYFVNSYYPQLENTEPMLYRSNYGETFTAAIQTQNITAFQFHPEKSGEFGQSLIQRWYQNVN